MPIARLAAAFLAAILATYVLASAFFTQQVLAKQAEIGAIYTPAQQAQTYWSNLVGLWAYGVVLAVGLLIAFVIAAVVKRFVPALAPISFPVAGATAVLVAIHLIEGLLGGGAGVIGGARDLTGLVLQGLAGAFGGVVFSWLMRKRA